MCDRYWSCDVHKTLSFRNFDPTPYLHSDHAFRTDLHNYQHQEGGQKGSVVISKYGQLHVQLLYM